MKKRNQEKGQQAAAKVRAKKKQRMIHTNDLQGDSIEIAVGGEAVKTPDRQNENDRRVGLDTSKLDKIRNTLNPTTPS